MLADLRAEGYVVRDEDDRRRYRLTTHPHTTFRPCQLTRSACLYQASLPAVIELHRRSRMSAHLGGTDGVERLARGATALGPDVRVHRRTHALLSPVSRDMHGQITPCVCGRTAKWDRAIAAGFESALSSATITNANAFRNELALIRQNGFALDREEYMPGLCACAAPVFQLDGSAVAAIAVVGDARILSDGHRSRTINLVRTIAGTIAPPNAIA